MNRYVAKSSHPPLILGDPKSVIQVVELRTGDGAIIVSIDFVKRELALYDMQLHPVWDERQPLPEPPV